MKRKIHRSNNKKWLKKYKDLFDKLLFNTHPKESEETKLWRKSQSIIK